MIEWSAGEMCFFMNQSYTGGVWAMLPASAALGLRLFFWGNGGGKVCTEEEVEGRVGGTKQTEGKRGGTECK